MIAIPHEAVRASLLEFLAEFWALDNDRALSLAWRPLKVKADEVAAEVMKTAINVHPLYPVLKYIILDIADHAAAIDALGKTRTTLLHVRHIEAGWFWFFRVRRLRRRGRQYRE